MQVEVKELIEADRADRLTINGTLIWKSLTFFILPIQKYPKQNGRLPRAFFFALQLYKDAF